MKKLIALIVSLAFLLPVFCACDDNNTATDDEISADTSDNVSLEGDESDVSEESDVSDESGNEPDNSTDAGTEPLYSGEVFVRTDNLYFIHRDTDFSEQLTSTLKVLNESQWAEGEEAENYQYQITVGESLIFYDSVTGDFYDRERNLHTNSRQPLLRVNKQMVNDELLKVTYTMESLPVYVYEGKELEGTTIFRDATKYDIIGELDEQFAVTEIETNRVIGVTAAYDGRKTRYFDSYNGDYLGSVKGKYLCACCNGFSVGEMGNFDRYSSYASFEDYTSDGIVIEDGHYHEGYIQKYKTNYYSKKENRAFGIYPQWYGYFGAVVNVGSDGYYSCRLAELYDPIEGRVMNVENSVDPSTLGKYGVVYNNEVVIPFDYDRIDTLQTGGEYEPDEFLGIYRAIKDGKTYYISTDGKNFTPDGFLCGSPPNANRATVFDGRKMFIIEFGADRVLGPEDLLAFSVHKTGRIPISLRDAETAYRIINEAERQEGRTDCNFEYVIHIGEQAYYYAPECGTFNYYPLDAEYNDPKHFILSQEQTAFMNAILSATEKENPVPPAEELYNGYLYTYSTHGTYHDWEMLETNEANFDIIRSFFLNADWQRGDKGDESFDFVIEFGHRRTASVYCSDGGLLFDETHMTYAQLSREDALMLAAIMRSPEVAFDGKTTEETFTIDQSTLGKVAMNESWFIATDSNGTPHWIVWDNNQELTGGCVVKVKYDEKFKLENTLYGYFVKHDNENYITEYALSALDVTIVSKPEVKPLEPTRSVDFSERQFYLWLKNLIPSKYGIGTDPIVFNTVAEWEAFDELHPSWDNRGATHDFEYETCTRPLTESYFKENTLIFIYARSNEFFAGYEVTDLRVENGVLTVDYTVTPAEGFTTDNEQLTLITIEVKKTDIADCKTFKSNGVVDENVPAQTEKPEEINCDTGYSYVYTIVFETPNKAFSITSKKQLDYLLSLTGTRVRTDNNGNPEKNPTRNLVSDFTEEFFEKNALICVFVNASKETDFDNMSSLELKNGNLSMTVSYINPEFSAYDSIEVLCYAIVDKDVVNAFDECILHRNNIENNNV